MVNINLKQFEKDWKIIAYRFTSNAIYPGHINRLQENGLFFGGYSQESMWNEGNMDNNREIYSIQRLCDGVVFTIGDKIQWGKKFDGNDTRTISIITKLFVEPNWEGKYELFFSTKDRSRQKVGFLGALNLINLINLNLLSNKQKEEEWESLGSITTWKYHSKVKRNSDGVIFEPGDFLVYLGQSFKPTKIIDIREDGGDIFFNMGKVFFGLNDPNVQKICKYNLNK